tara:strand:- start:299 stop:1027 length:729 start_codon:yes stop_codon:yes gene_type:complete
MNLFHQELYIHEDDTFTVEFLVDTTNLFSFDSAWFGVSTTPGGSYILQKANNNFNYGLFFGDITPQITTTIGDGTPNLQVTTSPTTDGSGTGASLDIILDNLGKLSTTLGNCNVIVGGTGYAVGDTLTVAGITLGASNDLEILLSSANLPNPNYIPAFEGDIYINAFQNLYPPVLIPVEFFQNDFSNSSGPLSAGNTYYWELIGGKMISYSIGGGYKLSSQVMAAGTLYVQSSLFTQARYRP